MRPASHHRLFTLPAAFGVLALTATLLVQAYPVFAQENNDANTPPHFTISATTINILWSDYNQASVNIDSPFVAEDARETGSPTGSEKKAPTTISKSTLRAN